MATSATSLRRIGNVAAPLAACRGMCVMLLGTFMLMSRRDEADFWLPAGLILLTAVVQSGFWSRLVAVASSTQEDPGKQSEMRSTVGWALGVGLVEAFGWLLVSSVLFPSSPDAAVLVLLCTATSAVWKFVLLQVLGSKEPTAPASF